MIGGKNSEVQTRSRGFELLVEKEKGLGRRIKPAEIARETGICHSTVTAFIKGTPVRFDSHTIDALMKYFEITSYDDFFVKKAITKKT